MAAEAAALIPRCSCAPSRQRLTVVADPRTPAGDGSCASVRDQTVTTGPGRALVTTQKEAFYLHFRGDDAVGEGGLPDCSVA